MKKFFFLLFGLFFTTSVSALPASVDYIFDGDTFAATLYLDDNVKVKARVRIINVDTPELKGKCEEEITKALIAKHRLEELLPIGVKIDLKNIKDDKYLGRIDANVFVNGKDIGKILIDENLGRAYSGGKRNSWCD